jgi:anti-sigma B factor antagonist
MMKIDTEITNGVAIITPHGKMMMGDGDDALRDVVETMVRQQSVWIIVLDLGDVPYVDASSLGEIVRSYTRATRTGKKFVLCQPTKKVADLLAITKLLTVFDVYDTLDEALAAPK